VIDLNLYIHLRDPRNPDSYSTVAEPLRVMSATPFWADGNIAGWWQSSSPYLGMGVGGYYYIKAEYNSDPVVDWSSTYPHAYFFDFGVNDHPLPFMILTEFTPLRLLPGDSRPGHLLYSPRGDVLTSVPGGPGPENWWRAVDLRPTSRALPHRCNCLVQTPDEQIRQELKAFQDVATPLRPSDGLP
jgi:hypothetical protein